MDTPIIHNIFITQYVYALIAHNAQHTILYMYCVFPIIHNVQYANGLGELQPQHPPPPPPLDPPLKCIQQVNGRAYREQFMAEVRVEMV